MTKFPLEIFNLPLWQIWSKKITSRMANVLKRASRQAKKKKCINLWVRQRVL